MRAVLQVHWLDDSLLGKDLLTHVSSNWGKDVVVLLPRGHGKTLSFGGIIIQYLLNKPSGAVLVITHTDANATALGGYISQHLMYNEILQKCFGTQHNTDPKYQILPASISECHKWGESGYILPNQRPRLDPSLKCISVTSARAGKHPDWIYLDDLIEKANNNPEGWAEAEECIKECKMLIPSSGWILWAGTRWHDGDPFSKVDKGAITGRHGRFSVMKRSCFIDDNPSKGVIFPRRKRWGREEESGETIESLNAMKKPEVEGGLGLFFAAQMRNDPAPSDSAILKVRDIRIFTSDEAPTTRSVRIFGIEITGGGGPIYNGFVDYLTEIKESLPLFEITNKKNAALSKEDKIVAALQPLIDKGALHAVDWMIGEESSREGLGYELRRLGAAQHDDIADCLHNIITHLVKGILPPDADSVDLYIGADLAWTENKRSDWSVIMAVAVDHKGNHWVLDYDRFQTSSPTGIHTRLLTFFKKWDVPQAKQSRFPSAKTAFPGAWK